MVNVGVRQPAARLYCERFPECLHPTRQKTLKDVKRLRETGCVTSRPRVLRPRNVGREVQPEDMLAHALAPAQSRAELWPLKKPRLDNPECIRCSSIQINTCAEIAAKRC
ncbi:hypothetical protein AVEN_56188-1 [Araneus ventricosus]|uniref:DUF4817 domain-containing protein n=1 Tax=Araneus ventricosus TaxID=182803 RepID=A0A4Y2IWK6_ARAVE|nr:hypothetical protein AVEN_56188-1 [Araneus ventricosus]